MGNLAWGIPWTEDEDATLIRMMRDGYNFVEISQTIIDRTYCAIKMRALHYPMTSEERTEAARRKSLRPRIRKSKPKLAFQPERRGPFIVPDEVWADRNRRMSAARSLTALICGDPPFPATRSQ